MNLSDCPFPSCRIGLAPAPAQRFIGARANNQKLPREKIWSNQICIAKCYSKCFCHKTQILVLFHHYNSSQCNGKKSCAFVLSSSFFSKTNRRFSSGAEFDLAVWGQLIGTGAAKKAGARVLPVTDHIVRGKAGFTRMLTLSLAPTQNRDEIRIN